MLIDRFVLFTKIEEHFIITPVITIKVSKNKPLPIHCMLLLSNNIAVNILFSHLP